MWKLFLDDTREPKFEGFIVSRSYNDAIEKINEMGCPSYIAFDFCLGTKENGLDLAKWLVSRDIAEVGKFIPVGFDFGCHSDSEFGRKAITDFLGTYIKNRK